MNASAPSPTAVPPAGDDAVAQAQREICDQLRRQEADRAFEAGVQWFLAVSRAA